jgi:hypothetical protein
LNYKETANANAGFPGQGGVIRKVGKGGNNRLKRILTLGLGKRAIYLDLLLK